MEKEEKEKQKVHSTYNETEDKRGILYANILGTSTYKSPWERSFVLMKTWTDKQMLKLMG